MSIETFHNLLGEKQDLIIMNGIKIFSQKSYSEASTDIITKECNISKGILFHYFGSKKNFYLYLLEYCLKIFTDQPNEIDGDDFYEIIFNSMDRKMNFYLQYPDIILFINIASKEVNSQVYLEKEKIVKSYMIIVRQYSTQVLDSALSTLNLKRNLSRDTLVQGLSMYVNAVTSRYLAIYQNNPLELFNKSEEIKIEMKSYISLFLEGVATD